MANKLIGDIEWSHKKHLIQTKRREEKETKQEKTNSNIVDLNSNILVVILHVNG